MELWSDLAHLLSASFVFCLFEPRLNQPCRTSGAMLQLTVVNFRWRCVALRAALSAAPRGVELRGVVLAQRRVALGFSCGDVSRFLLGSLLLSEQGSRFGHCFPRLVFRCVECFCLLNRVDASSPGAQERPSASSERLRQVSATSASFLP